MKTKQEYLNELTEAIEKAELQIEAIEKLKPVLKKLDGKNIRQMKFITNKLQEALPGFNVGVREQYSWYELYVFKTVNYSNVTVLRMNCGYINEVDILDFDLITGLKERNIGGLFGNNYYFGTDKKYESVNECIVGYKKQLENVETDYKNYLTIHEMIKAWNVPFLSIDVKR